MPFPFTDHLGVTRRPLSRANRLESAKAVNFGLEDFFGNRDQIATPNCLLYVLIIFGPKFEPGAALFIIWRRPRAGGRETIAAGTHRAMRGAWDAIQD